MALEKMLIADVILEFGLEILMLNTSS
jgi:hypothetical protein